MVESLFTVGNVPAIVQDLRVTCHVCGFTFAGPIAVRSASNAVMDGSKGVLERMFLILHFDPQACIHLRAMCWLRISKPLRHQHERCGVVLLPRLSNPPLIPSPAYGSKN